MNAIFNQCVELLNWLANLLGMSYVEINVWLFCVIWPIISMAMGLLIILQFAYIQKSRKKLQILTIPSDKYYNSTLGLHRKK